ESKTITADIAKELAKVHAVDKNGRPIDISKITVDPASLAALQKAQKAKKAGTYTLTFITPDGTKLNVNVTLTVKAATQNLPSTTPKNLPTGENSWLWILAVVVLAAAGAYLVTRRRHHGGEI
ncbi:MAG: hypothetical protein LBS17_04250, partial [Actinomycetes bacterium]|nr:hypothetical protein [Actinomycetes bacterium]